MVTHVATAMPKFETGLVQLAPNLFAYLQWNGGWGISNTGFLVGKHGVVVMDGLQYPSFHRGFMNAMRSKTDKHIDYFINTHSHGDHTNTNFLVPDSIIVSNQRTRSEIVSQIAASAANPIPLAQRPKPSWQTDAQHHEVVHEVKRVAPSLTYDQKMTIHDEDEEIQLLYYGPAHTGGDTVVFLPKHEVAFVGDLGFFYCTPQALQSITNWIVAVDRILELDAKVLVSGHGPMGGRKEMKEMQGYMEFCVEEARKGIKKGLTIGETVKQINLGVYAKWGESERITRNISALYNDLSAPEGLKKQ